MNLPKYIVCVMATLLSVVENAGSAKLDCRLLGANNIDRNLGAHQQKSYIYDEADITAVVLKTKLEMLCAVRDDKDNIFMYPVSNFEVMDDAKPWLNAVIFNSTWKIHRIFANLSNTTSWNVTLHGRDFFERPMSVVGILHQRFARSRLRWLVKLEAHRYILPARFRKRLLVVDFYSDFILQHEWGKPVNPPTGSAFEQAASTPPLVLHTPCQAGCALMILSSAQRTYFASSCAGFQSDLTSWYEWDCQVTPSSSCNGLVIRDGLLTSRRAILLTTAGLLVSDELSLAQAFRKSVRYTLQTALAPNITLDWRTMTLSYSPLCVVTDQLQFGDDDIIVHGRTLSGITVVLMSSEPYTQWTRHLSFANDVVAAVVDEQVRTLMVLRGTREVRAEVYALTEAVPAPLYPPFVFTSCNGPSAVHLFSTHELYVTVGNCLWVSTDGGNRFVRKFYLNEHAVRIVGCDLVSAFAIMTSQGTVYWGKSGVRDVFIAFNGLNTNRASLTFDPLCNVLIVNNQAGNSPHVLRRKSSELGGSPCTHRLKKLSGPDYVSYTQPGHHVEMEIAANKDINTPYLEDVAVTVTSGNPRKFRISHSIDQTTPYQQIVSIIVETKFLVQGVTSVVVSFRNIPDHCATSSIKFLVVAGCSRNFYLFFNYSSFLPLGTLPLSLAAYDTSESPLLYDLPPNYRPPSTLGISIPGSSNVYNVHPELVNSSSSFVKSLVTPKKLKGFCDGAETRIQCDCSPVLKFSSMVAYSDCKERVYRVLFGASYTIKITMEALDQRDDVPFVDWTKFYIYLEELNGRDVSVYAAHDNSNPCERLKGGLVCRAFADDDIGAVLRSYMASNRSSGIFEATSMSLELEGSGLFHFRLTLIHGLYFCPLQDEFQVFVVNPPLPFPSGIVIRAIVSVAVAILLIVVYKRYEVSTDS